MNNIYCLAKALNAAPKNLVLKPVASRYMRTKIWLHDIMIGSTILRSRREKCKNENEIGLTYFQSSALHRASFFDGSSRLVPFNALFVWLPSLGAIVFRIDCFPLLREGPVFTLHSQAFWCLRPPPWKQIVISTSTLDFSPGISFLEIVCNKLFRRNTNNYACLSLKIIFQIQQSSKWHVDTEEFVWLFVKL